MVDINLRGAHTQGRVEEGGGEKLEIDGRRVDDKGCHRAGSESGVIETLWGSVDWTTPKNLETAPTAPVFRSNAGEPMLT